METLPNCYRCHAQPCECKDGIITLRLCPIHLTEARRFVGRHHRHNKPPVSGLFAVAVSNGSEIVGVGIAGRPVARRLDDGQTVELTRICTTGAHNACSMLYGALCRAALALGYARAVTYTLLEEPSSWYEGSGWTRDAELKARPSWSCNARQRIQKDLFGEETRPSGPKVRWVKQLT